LKSQKVLLFKKPRAPQMHLKSRKMWWCQNRNYKKDLCTICL